MSTSAEIQAKVEALEANMDKFSLILNGGPTTTVSTTAGLVPSLSKFYADTAAFASGTRYNDIASGRAAVADGAYYLVRGAGDVAVYEYQRVNSTTSTFICSYASTEGAGPVYSLFPDCYFKFPDVRNQPGYLGRAWIIADGAKTFDPDLLGPLGRGAYSLTTTGSVAKWRVFFDTANAILAGITTGSIITASACVRRSLGSSTGIYGRFIDVNGNYVGSQDGTAIWSATDKYQLIQTAPMTVPAGAVGCELWIATSGATGGYLYVYDIDCTFGVQGLRLQRQKLTQRELASTSLALSSLSQGLAGQFDAYDIVGGTKSDVSLAVVGARTSRSEANAISGVGNIYNNPGGLTGNAVFIREIIRQGSNVQKWEYVDVAVRTHATDPKLATATLLGVGTVAIPPNELAVTDIWVPLRDPTTGALKTLVPGDFLATWGLGYQQRNAAGLVFAGDCQLPAIANIGGTLIGRFYSSSNVLATGLWNNYTGGLQEVPIMLGTITGPTLTRALRPLPALSSAVGGNFAVASHYEKKRLRTVSKAKRDKARSTFASKLSVALIGDSWFTNPAYGSQEIANKLSSYWGDAGPGTFGLGFVTAFSTPLGDAKDMYYPKSSSGTWTSNYHNGSTSPSISDARSSVAGSTLVIGNKAGASRPALTNVRLHFTGTADGVIKWKWGAGAYSADTPVQGTLNSQQVLNLTGFPTAALSSAAIDTDLLEIFVVSGTVNLNMVQFVTAAIGAETFKLGSSGSTSLNWLLSNAAQWQAGLALLAPNVAIIQLGVNDRAAGVASGVFASQMGQLIDRARAAVPGIDVLVMMPPETTSVYAGAVNMKDYHIAMGNVVNLKNAAMLNLQPVFGDPLNSALYDDAGLFPMLDASNDHPNAVGALAIADELIEMLVT